MMKNFERTIDRRKSRGNVTAAVNWLLLYLQAWLPLWEGALGAEAEAPLLAGAERLPSYCQMIARKERRLKGCILPTSHLPGIKQSLCLDLVFVRCDKPWPSARVITPSNRDADTLNFANCLQRHIVRCVPSTDPATVNFSAITVRSHRFSSTHIPHAQKARCFRRCLASFAGHHQCRSTATASSADSPKTKIPTQRTSL
jgi:hypothetical protein